MKPTFAFDMFDIFEVYKDKRERIKEVNKALRERALYPNAEFVVLMQEGKLLDSSII